MILRRRRILSVLGPNEIAPTITSFPLLGVGNFFHPSGYHIYIYIQFCAIILYNISMMFFFCLFLFNEMILMQDNTGSPFSQSSYVPGSFSYLINIIIISSIINCC